MFRRIYSLQKKVCSIILGMYCPYVFFFFVSLQLCASNFSFYLPSKLHLPSSKGLPKFISPNAHARFLYHLRHEDEGKMCSRFTPARRFLALWKNRASKARRGWRPPATVAPAAMCAWGNCGTYIFNGLFIVCAEVLFNTEGMKHILFLYRFVECLTCMGEEVTTELVLDYLRKKQGNIDQNVHI